MMDDIDAHTRKCPVCGKEFYANAERWVFLKFINKKRYVFCSWSCMRAFEKRRGTKADRRERIQQAIRDGLSTNEICDLVGAEKSAVLYWQKKMEEEKKDA